MFEDSKHPLLAWASPATTNAHLKLRRYWKIGAAALVVILLLLILSASPSTSSANTLSRAALASYFQSNASASHPLPHDQEAADFWRSVSEALTKGQPSFGEVKRKSDHSPWITFDRDKQDSERPDLLDLDSSQVDELKKILKEAKETFARLAPKLPFVKGTRGIVSTANNDALAIQTSSLWMLRASGSTLPVEFWFYDYDNWEDEVCNDIFPSLGAKCMFMTDYLPKDVPKPTRGHDEKFTFKTLTLLFSSFEQVLFLDCDAFPVMNPDSIFETEPFTSTGYVLWPDYWANTASRYFFDIVGRPVTDLKERAASESGEMIINKATHAAPILLANFYNYWGPEYWYRLWSQAAPGEGDKEAYLAAVMDFKLPWYQVNERPQRVGYKCDGHKHAIGSAQSHPLDDFTYTVNGITRHDEGLDLGESIHPRILFIHANMPKPDPYAMLDWNLPELEWEDMLRCNKGKGKVHRMWGPKELTVVKYGWDAEKALWAGMRWSACVHETGFKIWTTASIFRPEELIRHDLCPKMTALWEELFPGEPWSPHVPEFGARSERPWGGWGLDME